MQYPAKIDKDIVRELPVAQTDCEIEVIDSANEVATAVDCLMQEEVVGFDTETKPSFTHGKSNKIALMQISTAKKCFLFRLQMIGKSEALKNFLENEKIKKIGLALHGDLRNLRVWDKFTPKNFIDLQKIVIQYGIEELGLQRILCNHLWQKDFEKPTAIQLGGKNPKSGTTNICRYRCVGVPRNIP